MGATCARPLTEDSIPTDLAQFQAHLEAMNRHIPQISNIKLLSYNIFVRPPFINNNGDDYKDERISEFLKSVHSYDIICLQEMFGSYSTRRSNMIQKAQELGFLYHTASPRPTTFSTHVIDGGLLILSRFPIAEAEFCSYPLGLGADYYVNKGALYAQIQVGNSRLHLYNTHAQATYDETPKYFLKRMEQFDCFKDFIKDTLKKKDYKDNDLVLLTGDFNVNGREAARFNSGDNEIATVLQNLPVLTTKPAFREYEALLSCLSGNNSDRIEDLLLKNHNEHPVTFGDFYVNDKNERKPRETVLTHPACLCSNESLDYIFRYVPNLSDSEQSATLDLSTKQKLVVVEDSAKVEKFLVRGHDFEQLSDHYGVKITLQYSRGIESDKEDAETVESSYLYESMKRQIRLQ